MAPCAQARPSTFTDGRCIFSSALIGAVEIGGHALGECAAGRMSMRYSGSICVALMAFALSAGPAAAQTVDFGKYPNLKGQWVRVGNPNNWIPLAGPPPLTPEYQKIFDDITADVKSGGPGNWPSTFCVPAGMPAMMSFYDPGEIIVMPEVTYVLISHNDDSYRRIYTDGRDWPKEPEPTFAGYSIGKWIDTDGDGRYDLLEVETRGFKGPRAYDEAGLPLHFDNESIFKERIWRDKADPNILHDEITTYDHALTRPWTVDKKYVRNPDPLADWPEYYIAEGNGQIMINKENYFLSGEGLLMPAKKNQAPPDLRYFNSTQK
jgi:hypothetical protein